MFLYVLICSFTNWQAGYLLISWWNIDHTVIMRKHRVTDVDQQVMTSCCGCTHAVHQKPETLTQLCRVLKALKLCHMAIFQQVWLWNDWKQCEQLHIYQKQQVNCEHHTCRVVIQLVLVILLSITLRSLHYHQFHWEHWKKNCTHGYRHVKNCCKVSLSAELW